MFSSLLIVSLCFSNVSLPKIVLIYRIYRILVCLFVQDGPLGLIPGILGCEKLQIRELHRFFLQIVLTISMFLYMCLQIFVNVSNIFTDRVCLGCSGLNIFLFRRINKKYEVPWDEVHLVELEII